MKENREIKEVIIEYRKSKIQSEAEVSTKLLFPLIKALGYPSENVAQEFPVFGYAGRDRLHAKKADFVTFDDAEFAKHNKRTQNDLEWVYEHSLLVVEAKAPGEMVCDLGQVRFYCAWTKAVAYIESDGETIVGYYYNPINKDYSVLNIGIDNLLDCVELESFLYDKTCYIKQTGFIGEQFEDLSSISELEEMEFPTASLLYMRSALGRNVENSSDAEVVAKFLNTTNAILENDLRYDIPEFALDFPRRFFEVSLYIDNAPFAVFEGELTLHYWEEYDLYNFSNDAMELQVLFSNGKQLYIRCLFHVTDSSVSKRLCNLDKIKKCLDANCLYIVGTNHEISLQLLMNNNDGSYWEGKAENLFLLSESISSMKMLKEIEDYYEIKFKLRPLNDNEQREFSEAISFVHDGIFMKNNTYLVGPAGTWPGDCVIDESVLIEVIPEEKRESITLFNVEFTTYKSYLLPGEYKIKRKNRKKEIKIPVCCECKVSKVY